MPLVIIDFLRFNVQFAEEIYNEQPYSGDGVWNGLSYRPLEGLSIQLVHLILRLSQEIICRPCLMGNTIVWKPSDHQMLSAHNYGSF